MKYKYIAVNEALNCLIGKSASNIWETSIIDYQATIWEKSNDDRPDYPIYSKAFPTYKLAEAWANKMLKMR